MRLRFILALAFSTIVISTTLSGQHSIARDWNEELLHSIRNDFARPTIHARNLWHSSVLMYDLWTAINGDASNCYFLGQNLRGFDCPFDGFEPQGYTKEEATDIAISYAMYVFLSRRFRFAPNGQGFLLSRNLVMTLTLHLQIIVLVVLLP